MVGSGPGGAGSGPGGGPGGAGSRVTGRVASSGAGRPGGAPGAPGDLEANGAPGDERRVGVLGGAAPPVIGVRWVMGGRGGTPGGGTGPGGVPPNRGGGAGGRGATEPPGRWLVSGGPDAPRPGDGVACGPVGRIGRVPASGGGGDTGVRVVGASGLGALGVDRFVSEPAPLSVAFDLVSPDSGPWPSVSASVGTTGDCSCGDTSGALSGT